MGFNLRYIAPMQRVLLFFVFCFFTSLTLACASDDPPDKPAFSPLDPQSWASLRYPGALGAPAPRLVISEEGEILLDGTVLSAEQLPVFLPRTRGNKTRLEILAAPKATVGLVFALVDAALASGRTEISFLVSSRSGSPGVAPGLSWSIAPTLAVEIRANGALPSLSGREKNTELLLALSDALTIARALEVVEQLNGCSQRPCEPTRALRIKRSSQGALDSYYSVGKGVFTRAIEIKTQALKTPEEARSEALLHCPQAENASVIEVVCEEAVVPASRVIKGSIQKLEAARVCYRIFMDCSELGPLVVFIDGDSGDLLVEANE
jgi:hypothetical protein